MPESSGLRLWPWAASRLLSSTRFDTESFLVANESRYDLAPLCILCSAVLTTQSEGVALKDS